MTASGLKVLEYQDTITDYITSLYSPRFEVIEDSLDDDEILERDMNGKMEAFIILRYGPMMPKRRGKSFKGAMYDEYYGTVDVMAIANKGRKARYLASAIMVDLLGFKPDGTAPMELQDDGGMFAAFVVMSNEARPTRAIASQRFRYTINGTDVGHSPRPTV